MAEKKKSKLVKLTSLTDADVQQHLVLLYAVSSLCLSDNLVNLKKRFKKTFGGRENVDSTKKPTRPE